MDVSSELLETLRCSKCNRYLSRNPVFVTPNGLPVCHRCFEPSLEVSRNMPYEAVAKLLKFPCKYKNFGCKDTVPFAEGREEILHEKFCKHKPFVCLIMGSSRCDWVGNQGNILDHCIKTHPERVLSNPTKTKLNYNKPSESNYIINDNGQLFLLQVKATGPGGQIYHAVQCLNDSDTSSKYYFILDVHSNSNKLTRRGTVTPYTSISLDDISAVSVNTNDLPDFCGFNGVTFTVAVKSLNSERATSRQRSSISQRSSKMKDSDRLGVKRMIKSTVYQRFPTISKIHKMEQKKLE